MPYGKIFSLTFLFISSLDLGLATEPQKLGDPPAVAIWEKISKIANVSKKSTGGNNNNVIEIAGFITANEFNEGEISEFLLSRYPGGCVHVPLPPPSNIIHVTMEKDRTTPIFFGKRVIVSGMIEDGGRVDSSYEMVAHSVKLYPW